MRDVVGLSADDHILALDRLGVGAPRARLRAIDGPDLHPGGAPPEQKPAHRGKQQAKPDEACEESRQDEKKSGDKFQARVGDLS